MHFDPLRTTPCALHYISTDTNMTNGNNLNRFWFLIADEKQWYAIMKECRAWFGKNWKGMQKVRRKLQKNHRWGSSHTPLAVWFEVPDPRFATWIAVKMSLQVQSDAKFKAAK